MDGVDARQLPLEFVRCAEKWHFWLQLWRATHFVSMWIGLICSITVAVKLSLNPLFDVNLDVFALLSWVSLLCMWMPKWIQPEVRAERYHRAWRHLVDASDRYRYNNNLGIETLIDARKRGWQFISPGNAVPE